MRFAAGLHAHGHEPMLVATRDWPAQAWAHGAITRVPGGTPTSFAAAVRTMRQHLPCDQMFSLERIWSCDVYRAGDGVHAAWLERRAATEPRWRSLFRSWQPKHRALLEIERALFTGGAARIVVNSRMVANEIQRHFGTHAKRLHLVYNGYDLPAHESTESPLHGREATRAMLHMPVDAMMILFTGSGWERKGLGDAIAALRILDNPNLHMVVAGSGKMRPEFHHPRVHFPGPVLDMAPLYAAADVFVLPTLYDPFSNACLEAARHGLPVITSTANGFAELIEEEIHGHILKPGDVDELAAAIDYWSAGARALEARGLCAKNVARFTIAANVEATLNAVIGKSAMPV